MTCSNVLFSFLIFAVSCTEINEISEEALTGTWVLEQVFLSDAYDSPCGWEAENFMQRNITLEFQKEGELGGQGPVNRYFASYTAGKIKINQKGAISVGPIGSTKMAGPEPLMNCETRFFTLLNSAKEFLVTEEGRLQLGNFRNADSHPRDGGTYLIFSKSK